MGDDGQRLGQAVERVVEVARQLGRGPVEQRQLVLGQGEVGGARGGPELAPDRCRAADRHRRLRALAEALAEGERGGVALPGHDHVGPAAADQRCGRRKAVEGVELALRAPPLVRGQLARVDEGPEQVPGGIGPRHRQRGHAEPAAEPLGLRLERVEAARVPSRSLHPERPIPATPRGETRGPLIRPAGGP